MDSVLISFGSIIASVIVTVFVSRYYFRRSLKKSLTPYIQFSSSPLKGIDSTVRKQLEVKYQGHQIDNLFEIQFLIANTGDEAVRDIIEPLTLTVPEGSEMLDASILHVSPKGRTISLALSEDKRKVIYAIPLLNSSEFFITKILLNGSPKQEAFSFSISADCLPPTLVPIKLPFDAIQTSRTRKRHFGFTPLIFGLIMLFLGLAVIVLIHSGWSSLPDWSLLDFWGFVYGLGLNGWALFISILSAILLLVIGAILVVLSFTEHFSLPPKRKFTVPDDLNVFGGWRYRFPIDLDDEDLDDEGKN